MSEDAVPDQKRKPGLFVAAVMGTLLVFGCAFLLVWCASLLFPASPHQILPTRTDEAFLFAAACSLLAVVLFALAAYARTQRTHLDAMLDRKDPESTKASEIGRHAQ